jgi:hypothetical protein
MMQTFESLLCFIFAAPLTAEIKVVSIDEKAAN